MLSVRYVSKILCLLWVVQVGQGVQWVEVLRREELAHQPGEVLVGQVQVGSEETLRLLKENKYML